MTNRNIAFIIICLIIINVIANIFISLLNKEFRNGNFSNQLAQLKGLWLIFYLLPFTMFNNIIKSLVKDEKHQIRENKLKEKIRNKNRRR